MKKFDISNTSDWRPAALVCLYSPDTDTEEGAEKADYIGMLMDDIAEWIRADYDIDGDMDVYVSQYVHDDLLCWRADNDQT